MYTKPGSKTLQILEDARDLPTRCSCCQPNRHQLILISDDLGITLRCPKTRNALRVSHARPSLVIPGFWLGAME